MAHSWSIVGGVVTLTLDGSETGPISRSRTFTGLEADELYTFYLVVNPSVAAVNAFLAVDGGDTTIATITASAQTVRARGTTDGSGNITLRWGVQDAEAAPFVGIAVDFGDYANTSALLADWTVDDPNGFGVWSLVTPSSVLDSQRVPQIRVLGNITNGWYSKLKKTFTGFTPGANVRVRWWQYQNGINPHGPANQWNSATDRTSVADGSGHVLVDFSWIQTATVYIDAAIQFDRLTLDQGDGGPATIEFSDLTYCLGSGTSETGGTGLGAGATDDDPGNDPIPDPPEGGYPPPPTGGARMFGLFGLPPEGLGYWNFTAKIMSPTWIPNLISKAGTAGSYLLLTGSQAGWLDASGKFSFDLWAAQMLAIKNHPIAGPILDAAIGAGTTPAHMLCDEPYHPTRYGGPIPLATVERMGLFSKSLWPTWTTLIRAAPIDSWITRHINGCDWLWAEYHLRKGAVEAYRDNNIARAQALGHGLVFGIHYYDFGGVGSNVFVTPDQLRHYGGVLVSQSFSVAFGGWEYRNGLLAPSGMNDAIKYVRDLQARYDP